MARTIAEIKKIITNKYLGYEEVKQAYQLDDEGQLEDKFEEKFSKVSLESILFYIIAFVCWTVETLFDTHKAECLELLEEKKPHRLKWYRNKALAFQYGGILKPDSDEYETVDESQQVVKYAAVVEESGKLLIKVAGENNGKRGMLNSEYETALKSYFAEIKDAGVRLEIYNRTPDEFECELHIYYDPMVLIGSKKEEVKDAIKSYIENLPFNGEYSNMALIDVLQKIDGVIIPELKYSKYRYGSSMETIDAKATPNSGYFCFKDDSDLIISWIPYQTI